MAVTINFVLDVGRYLNFKFNVWHGKSHVLFSKIADGFTFFTVQS